MSEPAPAATNNGRVFSIISIVLGVVAILILPIILGPVGVVLGFVGHRKGDRLGLFAAIWCIVATIIGIAIGAAVVANN